MWNLFGGIANGGLSLISGSMNNKAQRKAQAREHEFQKNLQAEQFAHDSEMAKYEYQTNLEMWNRQNAYNSPAEQMKRYQEAGLNPNLLYGNISSGNSTSAPSYQAPRKDYSGLKGINQRTMNYDFINNLANSAMQMVHSIQDLQIKKSQKTNLDQRTKNEAVRGTILSIDKELRSMERDFQRDHKGAYDIAKIQEYYDLKDTRHNILKYQAEAAEYRAKIDSIKAENAERGIDDNPESVWALVNNYVNNSAYKATGHRAYHMDLNNMGLMYNRILNDAKSMVRGLFDINFGKLFGSW